MTNNEKLNQTLMQWNDNDWCSDLCYACTGYGDDFYIDELTGELVNACDDCPYNEYNEDN